MEHSRYLVTFDYQQRISPNKLSQLCDDIRYAAESGLRGVLCPRLTKAEISYLALYGYRVIQDDNSYSTLAEVEWN